MAGRRLRKGQYQATPGKYYGTPKEVWDFRTRATARAVPAVARDFLFANRDLFELERDLSNMQLRRVIRSLGAEHAIFSQFHGGLRVHRGYVTVHMDRSRRVYLCKNRAVPARLLPAAFDARITRDDAVRAARETLPQRHRIAQTRDEQCCRPVEVAGIEHRELPGVLRVIAMFAQVREHIVRFLYVGEL